MRPRALYENSHTQPLENVQRRFLENYATLNSIIIELHSVTSWPNLKILMNNNWYSYVSLFFVPSVLVKNFIILFLSIYNSNVIFNVLLLIWIIFTLYPTIHPSTNNVPTCTTYVPTLTTKLNNSSRPSFLPFITDLSAQLNLFVLLRSQPIHAFV